MYDLNLMIERIKNLKKEKKLSNEELSKISGVPIGTLAKILGSETKDPQISNIIKIAEALEISADYLIFGESKNTPSSDSFRLISMFDNLNKDGQKKVLEYIVDLSEMDKYKKYSDIKQDVG
jgi:transcriptional regulator with XRE-family HTH domain